MIIDIKNLTVEYDQYRVLDDISFSIMPGEIVVILGRSGCGKTTLLNHMIGLQQPKSGKIFIDHEDIISAKGNTRKKILSKFGVTFQSGALFGSMTLLENVRLPLEEFSTLPNDAIEQIAMNKLTLVDLEDFANYLPAQISGGMQKRTAIARAIALDPKILFFDEPTAGLDPVTSASIDQLILNLSAILGCTFVVVTHELSSIFTIAQRCVMLHNGHVIAIGKPQELKESDDPIVYDFFNRKVEQETT